MGDEQLAIDQMDVGFNAAEAVLQRIQQWALMQVMIVRMRAGQAL